MENKTNTNTKDLIQKLYKLSKKEGVDLWKSVAKSLEKPSRNWAEINLNRLSKVTNKGDKVIVPGKVLGAGSIAHKVDVYSMGASTTAKKYIIKAEGSCLSINDLIKKNPQGKGVRIIK